VIPCAELQPLLSAHAAGALDAPNVHRLEHHLAECERCREDLANTQAAFDLARLPPISDLERRSLANLPAAALTDLRRERVGTPIWRAFAAGFVAAAAIAAVIAGQTQVTHTLDLPAPQVAAWEEPDPSELLALAGDDEELEAGGDELARAELIADEAYGDVIEEDQ
jgi:anti-sigma factor RsiW